MDSLGTLFYFLSGPLYIGLQDLLMSWSLPLALPHSVPSIARRWTPCKMGTKTMPSPGKTLRKYWLNEWVKNGKLKLWWMNESISYRSMNKWGMKKWAGWGIYAWLSGEGVHEEMSDSVTWNFSFSLKPLLKIGLCQLQYTSWSSRSGITLIPATLAQWEGKLSLFNSMGALVGQLWGKSWHLRQRTPGSSLTLH